MFIISDYFCNFAPPTSLARRDATRASRAARSRVPTASPPPRAAARTSPAFASATPLVVRASAARATATVAPRSTSSIVATPVQRSRSTTTTSPSPVASRSLSVRLARASSRARAARAALDASARARFASSSSTLPEHVVLPMPALSPTMERGGIARWHRAIGDEIKAGDAIADVETDKATMAMEATDDGYLAAILVPEGATDVEVGTPVCVMCEEASAVAAFKDYKATETVTTEPAKSAVETAVTMPVVRASTRATARMSARASGERVFASPLARRLAEERGVRLETVSGSGPNGRVIAEDVLTARASSASEAVTHTVVAEHPLSKFFPDFEDVSVSAIKRVTAERLTESKQQVPHFYLTVDVRLDNMMGIRETLNKQLADDKAAEGAKISVNDFIVKASAKALLAVPDVNASWLGDKIRKYKKADISVAVQTERGLMVPIVRSACCLGLKSISAEVKSLAGRARSGSLTPQDMTGGTFTISNLGMFGVKNFAAIVNPPQAAILAVGGARKEVVKNAEGLSLIHI